MTRARPTPPAGTTLTWWTVSAHRDALPLKYEVRAQFQVTRGGVTTIEAAPEGMLADTIEGARQLLPRHLRCLRRDPGEDPPVLEVWL